MPPLSEFAFPLLLGCIMLVIVAAIAFATSDDHQARATQATIALHQQAAISAAQRHRAEMLQRLLDRECERRRTLLASTSQLEAENEALRQRVEQLSNLIRAKDAETITGMEVMKGPRVYLQEGTINLN